MKRKTKASLAAAFGLATALIAVPASASTAAWDPPYCPKEYFRIWASNGPGAGDIVLKTKSNWQGSVFGKWIFNNGKPAPGADHVQVYWNFNGKNWDRCLHFNPGPGEYQASFPSGATFYKVVWRGECDY